MTGRNGVSTVTQLISLHRTANSGLSTFLGAKIVQQQSEAVVQGACTEGGGTAGDAAPDAPTCASLHTRQAVAPTASL